MTVISFGKCYLKSERVTTDENQPDLVKSDYWVSGDHKVDFQAIIADIPFKVFIEKCSVKSADDLYYPLISL